MSNSGGVGLSVRALREAVGLSLEEAAVALNRDPAHLKRIEEGTGYVSEKMLTNISGGLAQWVADGSEKPLSLPRAEAGHSKVRTWQTRGCTVTGCLSPTHEWVDGEMDDMCVCASIVIPLGTDDQAIISGYMDTRTREWEAYAEIELPEALEGHSGLAHLERITQAFKQVQDRCDELNNTERPAL